MIHSKKIASSAKHPQLKTQESVLALIQLKSVCMTITTYTRLHSIITSIAYMIKIKYTIYN